LLRLLPRNHGGALSRFFPPQRDSSESLEGFFVELGEEVFAMMRKAKVADSIVVANVSDHVADEAFVVRKFSIFDILTDDIAKKAAEVFVTREGEEGAWVSQHSNEMREQSNGWEGVDLVFHSFECVIEPPTWAELNLAAFWSFLKGAASGGEDGIVSRVEIIDDGFRKFIDLAEWVEESKESLTLWPVADGIEARVGSEFFKEARVRIPLGAEVELHGPAFLRDPLADVIHDKGAEGIGLFWGGGIALASTVENAVGLARITGIREGVAHAVVGHTAAFFMEVVEAAPEGGEKICESGDAFSKLVEPSVEQLRAIDEEGFVGAEAWVSFSGAVWGVCGLVMIEVIDGVIGRSYRIDTEFTKEALSGEISVSEALIATGPNFFWGLGTEEGIDPEAAAEFKVGPIVERIAESIGDGFGVGFKFFARWGIARDVRLGNAICAHGPPFIVVVPEPEIGDVFPAFVIGHFIGRKMSVVINDGEILRCSMEERFCGFREKKEVVV